MTMLQGEEESCTIYGPNTLLLPIFRGLRVRVGIHTGLAEEVEINPVTRRVVYGGQVAKIAKAVSDAPSGGQIVISGDTLAEVRSVHDLMTRVRLRFCGIPQSHHLPPAMLRVPHSSAPAGDTGRRWATPPCRPPCR